MLRYVIGAVNAAALLFITISGYWFAPLISEQDNFFYFIRENIFNTSSLVPYFVIATLFAFAGIIEGTYVKYRRGQLEKCKNNFEKSEQRARREELKKVESMHGHLQALEHCLRLLLTSKETKFGPHSRVTIYRQAKNGDQHLRRIFRHAEAQAYSSGGRFRIPINEGVVGCAWANHGESYFSSQSGFGTASYDAELKKHLFKDGRKAVRESLTLDNQGLSMESRQLFAKTVNDLDSGRPVAVVVYESTDLEELDVGAIRELLRDQDSSVSRFIKICGQLDLQLNPDGGDEYAEDS